MGNILLFLGLFFTFFVKDGTAIKCWDCRSDVNPDCGDEFNNKTLSITDCNYLRPGFDVTDIPLQTSTCMKIIQTINGQKIIIRSCAMSIDHINPDGEQGTCVDKDKYNALVMHQCSSPDCKQPILCHNCNAKYCPCSDKDGCNSASNLDTSMCIAILLTMLTQLLTV
ncbi:UPAR/Ly6 domain-containing protein crok-like isoform X2 [Diabrotica undecimpunctata]|uniref:UPAR/Ly6 domain-containing protein crok-like isoform X2 n=1 Tax=Diabrotica undecimpunctata TaxID=50387 RepID=UPI003B6346C8